MEYIQKEERASKKSKREDSGKKEDIGDFSFIDLYKMKIVIKSKREDITKTL